MKKFSFPITAQGINLANRQVAFRYIIDNYSAYYDAIDIIKQSDHDALILSSYDDAPYFNFCIHKDGNLEDCIAKYLPTFKQFNRMPLIYITPASSYFEKELNFEEISNDAFMFLENKEILENHQVHSSIKIEQTTDEEAFIKLWGEARQDPNDIYGIANDEMINGMRHFFQTPPKGFNHFATTAYKENKPVANVVSVYNKDFLLVIGLGTLPEFRRQGLGTALMKDIVERANKLGIKTITLQTEAGTYNEFYYEKMGFATKFNGILYKI